MFRQDEWNEARGNCVLIMKGILERGSIVDARPLFRRCDGATVVSFGTLFCGNRRRGRGVRLVLVS